MHLCFGKGHDENKGVPLWGLFFAMNKGLEFALEREYDFINFGSR